MRVENRETDEEEMCFNQKGASFHYNDLSFNQEGISFASVEARRKPKRGRDGDGGREGREDNWPEIWAEQMWAEYRARFLT